MQGSVCTTVKFEGVEYDATVEFTVIHFGYKPVIDYVYGGEPGSGPEWDVEAIWLTPIDEDDEEGEEFLAKGVRFAPLYNSEEINDAIYTRVTEMQWEGV